MHLFIANACTENRQFFIVWNKKLTIVQFFLSWNNSVVGEFSISEYICKLHIIPIHFNAFSLFFSNWRNFYAKIRKILIKYFIFIKMKMVFNLEFFKFLFPMCFPVFFKIEIPRICMISKVLSKYLHSVYLAKFSK